MDFGGLDGDMQALVELGRLVKGSQAGRVGGDQRALPGLWQVGREFGVCRIW